MHRIPANSKVRRRLFPEDNMAEQARKDNFTNILKESVAQEIKEKSKKWNFDFKNEVPLDGPFIWYKREEDKWVGMKTDESKRMPSQFGNENTPVGVKDESVPLIRKRRKESRKIDQQHAKRKINFD